MGRRPERPHEDPRPPVGQHSALPEMAENHLTTACAGTSMVGTGRSSAPRPPDTGSLVPGLVASALEVLVSVRALRDLVPLLDVDLLVTRRAVEVTGLLRLLAG